MSMNVGFIGMGIMGQAMALNLIKAGYSLTVYNRTESKTKDAVAAGARIAKSPRACAEGNEVVISMVTDSADVEQVLIGEQGSVKGAGPGTVFVDMSTISPGVTRTIAGHIEKAGCSFLDAPVSGGDIGATNGTLTIMAGGDEEIFNRVKPIFEVVGARNTLMGPVGAGQATKACNQVLCAVNMIGVCEALALAHQSGIDLEKMHRVVTGGAGGSWALQNLGGAIIENNFDPGFMVQLMQKDLNTVLNMAKGLDLPLTGTALANQYFSSNEAHGEGHHGTQTMFKVLERLGNFKMHES